MTRRFLLLAAAAALVPPAPARADPPVASYIFPAGGRRGATVAVHVGGLNLHSRASFEMLGPGVQADPEIRRADTLWFEGPVIPLPDSQQPEDYPRDHAGRVTIAADAATGPRAWRVWTAQGASGSLPFVVGDLPEVVEAETDGAPVPARVALPVTVNGRIFPREDVDLWSFPLRAGEVATVSVMAGRLGAPLDPWLEALDPDGRRVAEPAASPACDARLAWIAASDGTYTVKIHDVAAKGGQNYVYRMTLTSGPSVERVFPLGGRRGSDVPFAPTGLGLPERSEPLTLGTDGAGGGPAPVAVRFPSGATATVEADDLPEALESEPNDTPEQSSSLPAPGIGNGRIDAAGDADVWSAPLSKDKSYVIEVRAARLGSPLDALLMLSDPAGKEVARAEGDPKRGGDPALTFQPPADGRYLVRVRDRFRTRGGASLAYRLRLAEAPAPDFKLTLAADTLGVPRGGSAPLKVEAERAGGFAGPITLVPAGLPEGVTAAKTVIAPGAASAEVVFQAAPGAPIRAAVVTLRGSAEVNGSRSERVAARRGVPGLPEIDTVRLAVALPTPFQITGPTDFGGAPRGSVHGRHYRLKRDGFAGPVEVRLADRQARHLQGVTGPVVTVPAGVDEFDYAVTLPPWMEVGRTSRAVVMATGVVREPDGSEHEVSFSSPKNEIQVVAVVGPGRLGLESGRTSLAVVPGGTLDVPVKVSRGPGVKGPVRVELVASGRVRGLSAAPLVLDGGKDEGVLRIQCEAAVDCPPTVPVVLRAVADPEGGPVTAEATLTLVARP